MNFDYSAEQQAIKRTARELLSERFKLDVLRGLMEAGRYEDAHWEELAGLGWPAIFIGEEHGGQGLGTVELAILSEELGYALAPVPFLSNAAAGLVIDAAGSDDQRAARLPGIASGETRGTVGRLRDGEAPLVPDADSADVIVLIDGAAATLHAASDCEIEPLETIDATRRYCRVRAGADGEALSGDPARGLDRAAVAAAAELVGIAQRTMEMAVDYARERKQFDRAIGAFQAVSHRCAEMFERTESARSVTLWAAWTADAETETLPMAAAMAKAIASDAAWTVTSSSLQVHGGIGFTWEHELHFFLKRAQVSGRLFGSAREHRETVASLSGLGSKAAEPDRTSTTV